MALGVLPIAAAVVDVAQLVFQRRLRLNGSAGSGCFVAAQRVAIFADQGLQIADGFV